MNPYGPTLFSFPDPRAPQWAMFILGLALLAAGGLVLLVVALDGSSTAANEDMIAGAALLGGCLLGGAVLTFYGLRNLLRSPEWHVSAEHAIRTRGERLLKVIALREQPAASITPVTRYGQVLSVRVKLGRFIVVTPSMAVAQAVVAAWQSARSR